MRSFLVGLQVILSATPNKLSGIFLMVSASIFVYTWFSSSLFHILVSVSIGSFTLAELFSTLIGNWTWYVCGVGSHLSPQMLIVWPFSTLHKIHSWTRSIEPLKLCHKRDELWPFLVASMLEDRKYLAFRICPARDFGSWSNLHICLASKALLKSIATYNLERVTFG